MAWSWRPHQQQQPQPIMCILIILYLLFLNFQPGNSKGQELELLLSFKSTVQDPLHHLSNWNPSSTSVCNWQGITCTSGNSSHVKAIELPGKNISGKLSKSSSIFLLPYLETINLSSNQLSGELPHDVFSSSSLRFLNLSNNNLTGSIPGGSVPTLESLDLSNNMLYGHIPAGIGSFSSLKFLDIGGNVLVGEVPRSITNLTSLEFLTLASNQLVGSIPPGIAQMRSLKLIYLGFNNLSGEIPSEIGELTSLYHLDLVDNNLSGQIPSSLGNLTNLKYLFLYQNKLTGPLPDSIFGLTELVSLDLSDNSLSGNIPELVIQLQKLEIFHLFSNNFSGEIPDSLASLPRLQVLQLWSNQFSGEIPNDLGKKSNLTVVDLSTNSLTGRIPDGLCNSGNLFKLILFSNSLHGEIPKGLSICKSLRRVRLQANNLSGKLPREFTKLPLVYFLDISGNNLSGRLDDRNWEMPSLQMLNLGGNRLSGILPRSFGTKTLENLDLSGNQFSGSIPSKYGNLSELMQLNLSGNKLTGNIPGSLSSCKKLVSLDLSHNKLQGPIPDSFSGMPVLGQLDLSDNHLSGEIPKDLGKIESLVQVNVSHNHFHGSLPFTGAFLVINASAVAGTDLCGGEYTSGLPPCKRDKAPLWWVIIISLVGGLVLLGIVAFGFVYIKEKTNSEIMERVENEEGIWELQFLDPKVSKSIRIDDIFSALEQGSVLSGGKKGNYCSCNSYKGTSSSSQTGDNGLSFVVKEMIDIGQNPPRFWQEMAELGRLRHPNVVKVLAACRSSKTAYLVYEYVEGQNLREVIRNLSWERRRRVAIGLAKALRFLHSNCSGGSFVAGYVSPEKVIVDEKDEARLRLSFPGWICLEGAPASKGFAPPPYLAPETKETRRFTEKGDMYGFGLLLIELLTGKGPADAEFGSAHETVVEWARYCYSECHLDTWIDPAMKDYVAANHQDEVVEAMNLALLCTVPDPSARACAKEVARRLECGSRITSCFSHVQKFSSSAF